MSATWNTFYVSIHLNIVFKVVMPIKKQKTEEKKREKRRSEKPIHDARSNISNVIGCKPKAVLRFYLLEFTSHSQPAGRVYQFLAQS